MKQITISETKERWDQYNRNQLILIAFGYNEAVLDMEEENRNIDKSLCINDGDMVVIDENGVIHKRVG